MAESMSRAESRASYRRLGGPRTPRSGREIYGPYVRAVGAPSRRVAGVNLRGERWIHRRPIAQSNRTILIFAMPWSLGATRAGSRAWTFARRVTEHLLKGASILRDWITLSSFFEPPGRGLTAPWLPEATFIRANDRLTFLSAVVCTGPV